MHWFIDPIKNHYADFDGRVGRQECWMFSIFLLGVFLSTWGLIAFSILLNGGKETGIAILLLFLFFGFCLLIFLPLAALTVRRLHDIGMSGWWGLIALIPTVGILFLVAIWILPGEVEANKYGIPAVPKTVPEGQVLVATTPPLAMASNSSVPMTSSPDSKPDTKPDTTPSSSSDSSTSSDGGDGGGGD